MDVVKVLMKYTDLGQNVVMFGAPNTRELFTKGVKHATVSGIARTSSGSEEGLRAWCEDRARD